MTRQGQPRRASYGPARFLLAPIVVVAVVAGIWASGGLLTDDFTLAMVLTGVWMGLSGLICLGVAIWRRPLALPVLGAYVLVAVLAGAYLSRSVLLEDEVQERVEVAAPAPAGDGPERASPQNVNLGTGAFEPVAHPARGRAQAIRLARGGTVLTLTGFEVDNGPDLRLYLVSGPARDESEVSDFRDLGALKGNRGDQQYRLPRGVDVRRYGTVVVWCRAFSVLFARAPLRRP